MVLDFTRADVYLDLVDFAKLDVTGGLEGDDFSPLVLGLASYDDVCYSAFGYLLRIYLQLLRNMYLLLQPQLLVLQLGYTVVNHNFLQ